MGIAYKKHFLLSIIFISSWGHFVYGQENGSGDEVRIGLGSITMLIHENAYLKNGRTIVYPREYSVYTQLYGAGEPGSMGCAYGGGFVIAARDFEAKWYYPGGVINSGEDDFGWRYVGDGNPPLTIPFFALDATTSYYQDKVHTTVPVNLTRYWKYMAPLRIVDGQDYSTSDWLITDDVKPDMISEQMAVATCNTSLGISFTQRAYSFSNQNFDDFIIVEYIFKNTGNIDADDEIEYPANQVQQCYLGIKFHPKSSGLTGKIVSNSGGWSEGNDDWLDYYGQSYINWATGGNGDSLRVFFGWDGDASPTYCTFDDEGDPLPTSGIFMSPQYPGMAILHADKAADDHSDDPNQPISSYYSWGGAVSSNQLSVVNTTQGQQGVWNTLKDNGYFTGPFDWDAYKSSGGINESWSPDAANGDPNHRFYKLGTLGFGPYDFTNIGDSIRILTCYTVGSMGWANAIELGRQWKDGNISETEKNLMLRSGRDSLFAKVSYIRSLFRGADGSYDFSMGTGSTIDQRIAPSPQWPDLTVGPGIEKNNIFWSDVAADSYKVYRRLQPEFHLDDPVVETEILVYAGAGDVLHWADKSVTPGRNYWYFVTAVKNDIESSKFVTRTDPTSTSPLRGSVSPTRGAEKTLDNVHVVPNPYHAHATRLYGWTQNQINFVGLPAACRIRIFTQTGDLVTTIYHELSIPPSSIEQWMQLTDSDQYVASGLYVYIIDQAKDHEGNDLGQTKTGKFVIIR